MKFSVKEFVAYNYLLGYMTKYNLLESQFIDNNLFKTMYSIFYFDLTEQMTDSMFSDTIKIDFSYMLSAVPAHQYNVVAIILGEQKVAVSVVNNKATIKV